MVVVGDKGKQSQAFANNRQMTSHFGRACSTSSPPAYPQASRPWATKLCNSGRDLSQSTDISDLHCFVKMAYAIPTLNIIPIYGAMRLYHCATGYTRRLAPQRSRPDLRTAQPRQWSITKMHAWQACSSSILDVVGATTRAIRSARQSTLVPPHPGECLDRSDA